MLLDQLWTGAKVYMQALDVPGLELVNDYHEFKLFLQDYFSSSFTNFLIGSMLRHVLTTFLGWFSLSFSLPALPGFPAALALRPFVGPQFRILSALRRYVADSGATNHLSYRLLPGDSRGAKQRVSSALGKTDWITVSSKGHCILEEPADSSARRADRSAAAFGAS